MEEMRKASVAAPTSGPESTGNGETAKIVSIPELKNFMTWHRIGQLTRYQEGAQLTYKDFFGAEHLLYIPRRELLKVRFDHMPGNVVKIEKTPNEIVISTEGRAYRSRSGKVLIFKQLPGLGGGGEAMTPWVTFLAALEDQRIGTPISISFPDQEGSREAWELAAAGGFIGGV